MQYLVSKFIPVLAAPRSCTNPNRDIGWESTRTWQIEKHKYGVSAYSTLLLPAWIVVYVIRNGNCLTSRGTIKLGYGNIRDMPQSNSSWDFTREKYFIKRLFPFIHVAHDKGKALVQTKSYCLYRKISKHKMTVTVSQWRNKVS